MFITSRSDHLQQGKLCVDKFLNPEGLQPASWLVNPQWRIGPQRSFALQKNSNVSSNLCVPRVLHGYHEPIYQSWDCHRFLMMNLKIWRWWFRVALLVSTFIVNIFTRSCWSSGCESIWLRVFGFWSPWCSWRCKVLSANGGQVAQRRTLMIFSRFFLRGCWRVFEPR